MRRLYILVVLVLFLGGYALAAQRMETMLAEGKTILLALAPVDPRAPLMGDYITATVLGGAKGNMAGQLVASQFQAAQNWALGSAMALAPLIAWRTRAGGCPMWWPPQNLQP